MPEALAASAQRLDQAETRNLVIQPEAWETEAWAFYHSFGELRFAIHDWLGNAMSRVRLVPAVLHSGDEEPVPITEPGPVADLVAALNTGVTGQAEMMRRLTVHLSVPGESYLVGEDGPTGRTWRVCSSSELRIKRRKRAPKFRLTGQSAEIAYELQIGPGEWRDLAAESMVVRIWQEDDQYAWKASSACQAALPIMREVDFYNRFIVSVLLSRLALNGLLLVPSEVTFPSKPEYAQAPDPFMAELIDVASKAIRNPGTAAAALPIPIRVPAQYIEQFKHLTFDTQMGDKVLEDRNRALTRLATSLHLPAEILTGVADMNHWGQWQMEESAIKIYISPLAETIVSGLTSGYLEPMLAAAGESLTTADGGRYVIWYDTGALAKTPDRAPAAQSLYDRGELSGKALRRENGFADEDKPSKTELRGMVLQKIALGAGASSMVALDRLLNGDKPPEPPPVTPPEPPPVGQETPAEPGAAPSPEEPVTTHPAPGKAPPPTRPAQPPAAASVAVHIAAGMDEITIGNMVAERARQAITPTVAAALIDEGRRRRSHELVNGSNGHRRGT